MAQQSTERAVTGEVAVRASENPNPSSIRASTGYLEHLRRPALWLVVLVFALTVLFWFLDIRARSDPPYLILALEIVFISIPSMLIAALSLRSFLHAGNWPVLWLGAGSLIFGLALPLGGFLITWANANTAVTASNLGILLAAAVHALAAFFAVNRLGSAEDGSGRLGAVLQVYVGAVGLMAIIAATAILGLWPPFFVEGQGGTPLRQIVVVAATLLFLIAGLAFLRQYARAKAAFVFWYALGLLLISLSLVGILLVKTTGTPLNWMGRSAQLLSGLYLMMAALVTRSEAKARNLPSEEVLANFFWRREANLRLLFDSVMDAVIVADQDFVITGWNPAAEAIYGWKAVEVIGKTTADVLQTKFPSGVDRQKASGDLSSGGKWSLEVLQRCRDGRQVAILSSASAVMDETGRLVGVVEVNRDITEKKRAEEERERLLAEASASAQRLAASNKELDAFAYSVSHDLRAPLRAIDGFAQALLEDCAGQLDDPGQRYLRLVRQNVQRMGHLIDDLLAFSRLGRQALQTQTVQPGEVVRRAWDDLRPEWADRQVELRLSDLPACEADPALLKQVYLNLLSNALKFTRGHSPAIIEVGCQTREDGAEVYFVKDNGVGFDMQYVDKVFGVFQRLHRAEEYEGTGVGLAIVQRVILRHGGQVWAEGEVGKGAAFYFVLGEKARE